MEQRKNESSGDVLRKGTGDLQDDEIEAKQFYHTSTDTVEGEVFGLPQGLSIWSTQ